MNTAEWNARVLSLIRQAVLAPSSHNTQPWRFRVAGPDIDLLADRARALPVNDRGDRELAISCGCALTNLCVAAANQGFRTRVRLVPDASASDWLARATLSRDSGTPGAEGALAGSIKRRRTYRKPFAARAVDSATVDRLVETANAAGAWLRPLLAGEARQQAAALVAEGDAVQWADPDWRRELAAWIHPRRRGDGLTVPAAAAPLARFVVRTFDMGGAVGARDRALAETAPLLGVLGTAGDSLQDRIQAGAALQHVLLVACQHGLQASYLNQPVQVESLRTRLGNLVGDGFPQLVIRFGYPPGEIPPAPRRPVETVVEWA